MAWRGGNGVGQQRPFTYMTGESGGQGSSFDLAGIRGRLDSGEKKYIYADERTSVGAMTDS